jgi:hypothetical protein
MFAACCSVLQCAAICCSVLQSIVVPTELLTCEVTHICLPCIAVSQFVAVCYSCCSVLQLVVVPDKLSDVQGHTHKFAVCCSVLQCVVINIIVASLYM